MTALYLQTSGSKKDDTIHSLVLRAVKLEKSPAYLPALQRFINLGLTEEEAKTLLKG